MHLIDLFDRSAAHNKTAPCLVDAQGSRCYEQVQADSCRITRFLMDQGVAQGRRVGVLSANCAEAFVAILGILRAGCVWVPLNSTATVDDLNHFISLVHCDFAFVHPDMQQTAEKLVGIKQIFPLDRDIWQDQSAVHVERFSRDSDSLVNVFSTGGTTGLPKAARWTLQTWHTMIANFHSAIRFSGPPNNLVAPPMTHAAGVVALVLIAIGARTYILDGADPLTVMESIEKYHINTLFLPPTVIYMMLAHPRVRDFNYESLEQFIYMAAPMSVEKLREAIDIFGPVMSQTYGQAEAPAFCTFLTREDHTQAVSSGNFGRLASCGRAGLLTDVAILNKEGEILPSGEAGEIVIRGPLVMQGYDENPEATDEVSRYGWHHTGDIGSMDEDGYVYITDRKRDMIISGGFNVFPSEIEQVIWAHPAVQECAVVGVPDEKWGEAVTAVIELKEGKKISPDEIRQMVKEKLGSIKTPKTVAFWPTLPRSGVGKVLKKEIRKHFWSDQQRQV